MAIIYLNARFSLSIWPVLRLTARFLRRIAENEDLHTEK